jgi:hypothetical protein
LGKFPEGVAPEAGLPGIIERLARRIITEAPAEEQGTLLTAAFILSGLRTERGQLNQLFQRVFVMRESSGYQIILDEGRTEEAQKIIRRLASKRLGSPDEAVELTLKAIEDIERLERIIDRYNDAADWQDLLATP